MKKELKEFIKNHQYSDDDILELLQGWENYSQSSEKDIKDENDESDASADSEEQTQAEKPAAPEPAKPELKMTDLSKMIATAMVEALKAEREATLLPAQKPLKPAPKPKSQPEIDLGLKIGEFNLV